MASGSSSAASGDPYPQTGRIDREISHGVELWRNHDDRIRVQHNALDEFELGAEVDRLVGGCCNRHAEIAKASTLLDAHALSLSADLALGDNGSREQFDLSLAESRMRKPSHESYE